MTQFKRLLVLVFLGCGFSVAAQTNEGWRVVEATNAGKAGQPLPGVTIRYGCDSRDSETQGLMASDVNGNFDNVLALTECPLTCWASFSFVGYEPRQLSCSDIERNGGVVVLTSQTEALDAVVVTASISGSTVEEETVPVTVLKPYLAESANALDLKGLVSKTPGVSILDGQVSIRGGSGYSYGVGSRVQMLLDGMPLLSGDLGEIWWSYLPMEHVSQVEVVKATASSMYGSGASNGVIHMRTAWPGDKPETVVSVFNGVYDTPDSTQWRWWDESYSPISSGMSASHRQAFGKLDIVAGGSVFSDKTYLSVGHEQRLRANAKFRYRFSPTWQFGGAWQGQYQQMGRFILWDDFATNVYLPMDGTSSEDRWLNWHADAWVTHAPLRGGTHHFNLRTYETSRYGGGSGRILLNLRDSLINPSMTSRLTMAQYRYSHTFAEQLSVQVGAFGSLQRSFSSLYPGITLLTFNVAQFAQMEWARSGWKLAAGVRNESNLNPGVFNETSGPILRFGLNRQLTPTTNVRLSYGESLRFASLAERYVEGSITDGVSIRGNLDLISESGNNVELGLIQRLESDAGNLLLEGAAFVLNYDEMIEYTLLPELDANGWLQTDEDGNPLFYFQPLNLGRTRIMGFELSATGDGQLGRVPVRAVAGYTYNYAGDLTNDPNQDSLNVYMENFFASFGDSRDSLVTAGSLLKYRNKGAVKLDVEWDMGPWTAGVALNHQSFIDAVDEYFEILISGLVNYREQFTNGSTRWDTRLSYTAPKGQRFSLIVNNITNGVVSTRPGIMGAPRHVMLKFDTTF
jgi:iron complex outermembrane receptor protein